MWSLEVMSLDINDHLKERFAEILGWQPVKITMDWYDNSAEIHGMPVDFKPSQEKLGEFAQLGLSHLWLHVDAKERRQPGEQSYPLWTLRK